MVVNGRPLKRAKRRVTADLFDFLTFPGGGDDGISKGPFRSNVRSFLEKHGRMPPPPPALIFSPSAMTTWRVAFRIGEGGGEEIWTEGVVEMDVVEEEVIRSRSVYCDQCRVVGEFRRFQPVFFFLARYVKFLVAFLFRFGKV